MASNTVVQVKRTAISGRPANTTTIPNPGELALNMTDGILYSTNGSIIFEIGANNTNVRVSNTLTVKAISANSSVGVEGEVLTSNGSGVYWRTVTGYAGSQGYTGSVGYAGSQGYTGSVGYVGSKGDIGFTGSLGYTGSQGYSGSSGYTGSVGYVGSKGTTYIGNTAPGGAVAGDTWWNNYDGVRYVYYTDADTNQWVQESAVGPMGYTGSAGSTGSQGYTGSASTAAGYAGSQGAIGYTGSLGYTGSQGYTGSASTAAGYTGSQGAIGYTGSLGYTGSQGYTGSVGNGGSQGYSGSQGYTGSLGYAGSQGYSGSVGYTGSAGYTGSQGVIGYTGSVASGPAFSAYPSGAQTITSGSLQKMLFQTEEYDTNNNFASSRFTPTVAGYYQFNATVRIDGATGTGECMIVLFKNNAEYKRGWNSLGVQFASSFWSMSVSAQAYANGSSDYFEIYIQQGNGSSLDTSNFAPITYFQGCMIRAA